MPSKCKKGREVFKRKRNLHIKKSEFLSFMKWVRENCAMKYYYTCMAMFAMGFRVGMAVAINLFDFQKDYWELAYRNNKSPYQVEVDPVPAEFRELTLFYVKAFGHTLMGGWTLPNGQHPSKGFVSAVAFEAWFSKARQGYAKSPSVEGDIDHSWALSGDWVDTFDQLGKPVGQKFLYRFGTHSFRRLHRTTFVDAGHKHGFSMYEVKTMCRYQSWKNFEVYINQFKILENHHDCVQVAINPLIREAIKGNQEQTSLNHY